MPSIYISDAKAKEKPCLRCGLSLRKLFDNTHCPRCGLSIWLSLSENESLEWSNPPWGMILSRAAGLLAMAQLIGLAAFSLATLPLGDPPLMQTLAAFAGGVYLIIYHAALLLASAHEQRYPDRLAPYRLAVRIVSAIAIVAGIALIAAGASGTFSHAPPAPQIFLQPDGREFAMPAPDPHAAINFALRVLFLVSAVATWAYFRRLARRLHNAGLITRICGILLFGPLIGLLKFSPFLGFALAGMFLWIIDYLPWLYLPVTLWLFLWLARDFHRASISATESWGKETILPNQQPANETTQH